MTSRFAAECVTRMSAAEALGRRPTLLPMPRLRLRRRSALPATPKEPPTRTRRLVVWGLTFLTTVFWAWFANLGLDLSTWSVRPNRLWSGPFETREMPLNVLVVWLVILLVLALTGRLWLTLGITGVMVLGIGAINAAKLNLRDDPVRLSDVTFIGQPDFLASMVGKTRIVEAVVVVIVALVGAVLIGKLVQRWLPNVTTGLSKRGVWIVRGARVAVAVICLALLQNAGDFNEPGNMWHAAYKATGVRWHIEEQRHNFLANGFVAGILYNTHIKAMKTPPGYSKARMTEIANRYSAEAAEVNKTRTGSLANTNVISILSESFTQPAWLRTVKWSENLIPKITAQMGTTVSGKMLSPTFAGGTANVEFELLTGQSLSQFNPQLDALYEQVVSKDPKYPSAVEYFNELGHKTIALHPFNFRLYQRPKVYSAFGFDQLIDADGMEDPYKVDGGRYNSDQSAFNEALTRIDSNSKPLFMHLISMQNHMPYQKQYDDGIPPVSGLPAKKQYVAGQYARGIRITDKALAEFFDRLKEVKEPTAVIFYGDHLPAQIYPWSLLNREGVRTSHETPFLIWSNQKQFKHTALPTTSPTQLLPKLFDATNAPIPPYYALLEDLDKQLPALDDGLMIDGQNQVVKPKDLTTAQRQILTDYRLVQYDLSIGKRYTEKVMFGDPPR